MIALNSTVAYANRISSQELKILDFIQDHLANPFFDAVLPVLTRLGDSGIIWILLALCLIITKKYRRDGVVMGLALLLCLLIGNIILKPLIARTRPYDVNQVFQLLIPALSDYSFPSGHTMSSFAAATTLMFTNRKWGIPALILAAMIAFSRLYLYVHYPSDVLAGMLIGVGLGVIAVKIVPKKWTFRKKSDSQ